MARIKDSDGKWVTAGDNIHFAYGIPGISVTAKVIERDGSLIALTPSATPKECGLKSLQKHVGDFWKTTTQ